MMTKAREKQIPDLILADAESLPIRSKSFEVAMIVHLPHLVDDWRSVVGELVRVASRYLVSVIEKVEGPRFRDLYLEAGEDLRQPAKKFRRGGGAREPLQALE